MPALSPYFVAEKGLYKSSFLHQLANAINDLLEQGCQTYGPRDDPKKHKNHTIGLYLLLVVML